MLITETINLVMVCKSDIKLHLSIIRGIRYFSENILISGTYFVNLIIIYSNTNSLDTCEHKDIIKSTGWWEIARKRTQIQNYIAFHLPFHVYLSSLLFKLLVAARICVPHNLENHVLLHLSRKENWVFNHW